MASGGQPQGEGNHREQSKDGGDLGNKEDNLL
jgi:hypothetical protein